MKSNTVPTCFSGLRMRHLRVSTAGKAILNDAVYAAFIRSNRGSHALRSLRTIKDGLMSTHTVGELKARGKAGTVDASLYLHQHIGDLLGGTGNVHTLSLLHSWMGRILLCTLERRKHYKKGHIECDWLHHATKALCAGRRALVSTWRREVRTGRVGFARPELAPFKTGCAEGFLVASPSCAQRTDSPTPRPSAKD